MNPPEPEEFLICDDELDKILTSLNDKQLTAVTRRLDLDAGLRDATEPAPDPGHWVMVGWRDGDAKYGTLTREQILAVWNTCDGPCARCATRHHRYGPGGQPLCPDCRTPPERERTDP